jgi:hypothetical protein
MQKVKRPAFETFSKAGLFLNVTEQVRMFEVHELREGDA